MSVRVGGFCYTGDSAEKLAAEAICSAEGQIRLEPELAPPTDLAQLVVSTPVGHIARTISFPNGAMFETTEHAKLNLWLTQHQTEKPWVHLLESNWRFVFLALFMTGLILFAGARWGVPAASSFIAYRLPPEVSSYIGTGTLETLDERIFRDTKLTDERQQTISSLFDRALTKAKPDFEYRLLFRGGGPIGPNAFALPDGTVVITDELIALAKEDDEIMSVLLHEIGHVEYRHSLRMVISHSGLAILSLAIIGDVNSAGTLVLALPSLLVESSYSRDLETEADDYALQHMLGSGINPIHFANFMSRLEKCAYLDIDDISLEQCEKQLPKDEMRDSEAEKDFFSYLASHPATEERIRKFRDSGNLE